MADALRGGGNKFDEFFDVDFAGAEFQAGFPDNSARTRALALVVAIQHGPAGQGDGGDIDRRRAHQHGRRGFIAPSGQDHAVDGIAMQHFDQGKILQVAVQGGGGPLAGFLDGMDGKFNGYAARIADTGADPLGQFHVVAVARRQIAARLGDADDRPAGAQFLGRQAKIKIAFQIQRRHFLMVGIVEPALAAKFCFCFVR